MIASDRQGLVQGQVIEITIASLSATGDGVGRYGEQVIFVPDTVPGDRVAVRLLQVKPRYAHAQIETLLIPSPDRVRPPCIVADKCGGCQWQPVSYAQQLAAKQAQVSEALERIGKFKHPPVAPILAAPSPLAYRNKVTYPLRQVNHRVQAGYYRKGSHRLVNLNQCPVQDDRLNPLLADVKQDLQQRGWPIYDEHTHRGLLRHLSLRVGRRTGEILLTLVTTDWQLPDFKAQAEEWLQRYPALVGVCLNRNPDRTNAIFGCETRCIAGRPVLTEQFAGLEFEIGSETFFQVYTEQAERLVQILLERLQLQGTERIVDAYCGIGTLSLPIARQAQQVIGLEIHPATVAQAKQNAIRNGLTNVSFYAGPVEQQLPQLDLLPDIVVLDPPRKGCDRSVVEHLSQLRPPRIVYMSCNPATLARDLHLLCQANPYELEQIQPADFFPQTAHVETLAFLRLAT